MLDSSKTPLLMYVIHLLDKLLSRCNQNYRNVNLSFNLGKLQVDFLINLLILK